MYLLQGYCSARVRRPIPTLAHSKDNLVSYCADSIDDHLDHIAVLQKALWLHEQAHSAWRSRLDDRPLAQRGAAAQMRDDLGNAEDLIRRLGLLPHLAVDLGDVVNLLRVRDQAGCHDARTDGSELVK